MIYIIVLMIVWCVISFCYFFSLLGHKFREEQWYDYPLLLPFLGIVTIAGWICRLFGRNK